MTKASDFLIALAQALSTMNLYAVGHPARERAIDLALAKARLLQEDDERPEFTFLGDEVVFGKRPLRDLRSWDWGARLTSVGIERLEFLGPVSRDELEGFLDEALTRLTQARFDSTEARQMKVSNIRYGTVGTEDGMLDKSLLISEGLATATLGFTLREEADAVRWIHQELQAQRELNLLEAEAVVRSLSVAMHGEQEFLIPLLRLKEYDQYTTTHALNVAVLTMALAEALGLGKADIRRFGIAGLLHDLGKVKVPEEILNKPGKLSDEERRIMNTHPEEGAKMILSAEENLDLAAVVAYEHHIKINGGGYPSLAYHRKCHKASDLVHVCDVFDALRTDRPYRPAWPTEKALSLIREGAGEEFDSDLSRAFIQMMERWETRVAELVSEDAALPFGPPGTGLPLGDDASAGTPPPAQGRC